MYNNEYKYLLSGCLAFYYSYIFCLCLSMSSLLRWILCGGSEQIQDQQSIITSLISISKVILFNDLSPFPSYLCKQALKLLCGIPERLRQPQLWTLSGMLFLLCLFYREQMFLYQFLILLLQSAIRLSTSPSCLCPKVSCLSPNNDSRPNGILNDSTSLLFKEILSSVLNPILTPILNTSTNLDQLNVWILDSTNEMSSSIRMLVWSIYWPLSSPWSNWNPRASDWLISNLLFLSILIFFKSYSSILRSVSHNPLVWLDCFMMLPIVVILTLQLRDCLMVCSILLIGFSIVPMIYFNWFLSLLIMSLFNLLFLFFLHCFRCLLFLFVVSIRSHSDYE